MRANKMDQIIGGGAFEKCLGRVQDLFMGLEKNPYH